MVHALVCYFSMLAYSVAYFKLKLLIWHYYSARNRAPSLNIA